MIPEKTMSGTPLPYLSASEGYRLWADHYDEDPNPMLSLEQRMVSALLPNVAGKDVVDVGCGTGRWLYALAGLGARSLTGLDLSPEMLGQAQRKLPGKAKLLCGDYRKANLGRASADLVLCNFVLSYIEEPFGLLQFLRSILCPHGSLFLSDVHPDTAAKFHWRRGPHNHNGFLEIHTHQASMAKVMNLCGDAGFAVRAHLEPCFGDEERVLFCRNGKGEYFERIREHPAIYLLQLTVAEESHRKVDSRASRPEIIQALCGGRCALGPTEAVRADILIHGSEVQSLRSAGDCKASLPLAASSVDLSGYLTLPGLINAHDHLEFALYPRLGRGDYRNFLEWAEDIHRTCSSDIARHRGVPKSTRLWWGGIRNLLCGVTTVCHHNPFEPEIFTDDFIVRVLKDYGWAHSLPLDPSAAKKRGESPKGRPFLIHLAEGIDEQSADEIFELDRGGALDEDVVIIHGLALDAKGKELLRSAHAGLIWCPSSNRFLFGKSMSSYEIRAFPRVALGSDSPLTAEGDLLDEIRYAHRELCAPADKLYQYVTHSAADLLRLSGGEGTIRPRGPADLIVVRDVGLSPAGRLSALSYREIELVLLGGRLQLVSEEMKRRLPHDAREGLQPLSIEGTVRWIRAPVDRLIQETSSYLKEPLSLGGKRVSLGS